MRKKWAIIGSICAIAILGILGCCLLASLNPSRQSKEAIQEEILKATPIGSTEDFVDRYAKSRFNQDKDFGWAKFDDRKLLGVFYGSNIVENFPYSTWVRVSWHFDKEGKLTTVLVVKWIDGPKP